MSRKAKSGSAPDAAVIAAAERASLARARIQASLDRVLDHNDEQMRAKEAIPLSWLTREKNLLAHVRSADMWDNADGGEDGENAPR